MYDGKRVCVFAQGLPGGGAERALVNLMNDFVRKGIAVDLLVTERCGKNMDRVPSAVNIKDLGTKLPRKSVGALVKYLKSERPDALITAMTNTTIIAIVARRLAGVSTRIGTGIHNTLSAQLRGSNDVRASLSSRLMRWFYPSADLIAAVGIGVADDFAAVTGISRKKIIVVYPLLTDNLLEQAKEPVEHPWFNEGEPPVILTVGRLSIQKEQTVLIDAFAELRKKRECRLMILGEGPERPKLEARVAEHGLRDDIALPGFAPNPFAYMARSAVFALSSRWEGMPMVLVEALACGCQVVSTNCPSGPDEILAGGKYGWLVPMGDPSAMAKMLSEALDYKTPRPADAWERYCDAEPSGQFCRALLGEDAR